MLDPREASERVQELERIAERASRSVAPFTSPDENLPNIRAILQFLHYATDLVEYAHESPDPDYEEDLPKFGAIFEREAGRPFDLEMDALDWEEADALPFYPPDLN